MPGLDWDLLLSDRRLGDADRGGPPPPRPGQDRLEHERDHDRILYATPVRRLADKTQVFPLERNDGIRTRLTHSHEVSAMARSVGVTLAFNHGAELGLPAHAPRSVPALLAGLGMAHDLGNPPFGHQGEAAIRSWIAANARPRSEDPRSRDVFAAPGLGEGHRRDFLAFEGNAQTLRLLTRLQAVEGHHGLDLTCAFLAGLMKYPGFSDSVGREGKAKFNVFQSERGVAEAVWAATGLGPGIRHPLTILMEACDDIAYCVVDLEDAARKGIVRFPEIAGHLRGKLSGDPLGEAFLDWVEDQHAQVRGADLSPAEVDDRSMQRFRHNAIGRMVAAAIEAFLARRTEIMDGRFHDELLSASSANRLWRALKNFARAHVYAHRTVQEVELTGHSTIHGLMDILYDAVVDRSDPDRLGSRRPPYAAYVWSRMSENYRRAAERADALPMRYVELQLVTDMVAGMTDTFAVDLYRDLRARAG